METPASPTALTLMLLLDAFRPDYLQHTPYLRDLAGHSATGCLRECFGFLPRAAYFGGLDAEQFGFTNMYCFDPENSVFSSARAVTGSQPRPPSPLEGQLRKYVEERARSRVPAFARHYVSTAQIPLAWLPYFDLVEKRAPWDKQVGYESLFALLARQGISWNQCSWPESNQLAEHSDAGIVRHVEKTLNSSHRFFYIHLQELDGIGHAYGPNSRELQNRLAHTDALCQRLITHARAMFPAVNVVLFGDHGMVSVTRTLDLTPIIQTARLRYGTDFVYFLDSTMARFWFYHRGAETAIRSALQDVSGGHLLDAVELKQFGIAGCDRRNGELIFLADPGVLLFPNFFQWDGEPIKGMHGYDPDCPDNLGLFLLHRADQPGLAGQQLGKVNPYHIYPMLKKLIGLDRAGTCRAVAANPGKPRRRFTSQTDPSADAKVQSHMDAIVSRVRQRVGAVDAIVLTGSFGRGEGGIYKNGDGDWHAVNDYDVFVVSQKDCSHELKALSDSLAKELALDYLDLGWSDGQWANWPLTVANYDLKYGSQVVAGDGSMLDRLPAYASAELPIYEAVKLLLNRTAGLLTGLRGEMLTGTSLTTDQHRYLCNQIAKAQMALGDSCLIRWGGYDASYRLRLERFTALAAGAGVADEAAELVKQGYNFKLLPDYSVHSDAVAAVRDLLPHLNRAIIDTIRQLANRRVSDLAGAMTAYLTAMSDDTGWVQSDNALFLGQPVFRAMLKSAAPSSVSLRHQVYSALPELLIAAFENEGSNSFNAARARLEPPFKLPEVSGTRHAAWEQLRATTVAAWFSIHH